MTIKAIFAVDKKGGLGKNGTLPWEHDKEDMRWFKNHTSGHIVVMGSNTWIDPKMPKPLPNRICAVVSNQDTKMFPEAQIVIWGGALEESLASLLWHNDDKDIWIIGGAKLIKNTSHLFKQIYLTTFDEDYDCDVSIDTDELLKDFEEQWQSFGKNKIFSVWKKNEKL